MRLEILLTAALFFGGTFFSGYALRRVLKIQKEGFAFSIVAGTALWWALMEVILVPMTIKLMSFQSFVSVYSIAAGGTVLLGAACYRDILADGKQFLETAKGFLTAGHIIAFALAAYQLYFIHHHMYMEWDDTYYVNLANEAVHSNRIYWVYPETGTMADFDKRYVLSLWPIFYAWLSKLVGVAPTVMAHTILPWLMIPLAYMVYFLIGKKLFAQDRQLQGMFLAMAVLLHLFMTGEHTSGLTFLSITPWVGKGVLAAVLIPLLFYWLLRGSQESLAGSRVLLGITALGGCLLSSMGIMLSPVFIGSAVFLTAVYRKDIRYFLSGMAACLPCIALGCYYIYLTR